MIFCFYPILFLVLFFDLDLHPVNMAGKPYLRDPHADGRRKTCSPLVTGGEFQI